MTATDRQIEALFRPLHELARRPNPQAPTVLDTLEERVLAAAQRNRTGTSKERDGYPTGNIGAGGDDAPQSSTEGAAISNLTDHNPDPINDHVEAAIGYLQDAVLALGALRSRLALIDHLSTTRRNSNPPSDCKACNRTVMCTAQDPIRSGYCNACDIAWRRWKLTEETEGRHADRARFEHQRHAETAA